MDTCLDWLLNYSNVSCIMGQYKILYLMQLHNDQMKQAEPCFSPASRGFIMRKGSPYTPSFNRVIRVTQESRFVQKWSEMYKAESRIELQSVSVSVGREMMKFTRYYCSFSFMIVFVNSCLQYSLPFEPLIGQIYARQVLFLYRSNNQKYQRISKSSEEIVNWIYSSFVSRLPCAWIDIDHSSYWRPLNICLMMMGSPITAQAVTLRERLLFGCVLLLSLFYSSSILAHLTNLKLDLKAYMSFKTYQELDESGLIPVVDPYWFNMTFRFSNDPALYRLGEKAFLSSERETCVYWLLNYANVSCILGQHYIRLYTAFFNGQMKQAEPCFWSTYRAFIVRKGSPYLPSFNRIIRAAQESGKVQSLWQDYYEKLAQLRDEHRVNVTGLIEENFLTDKLRNNSYRNVFFLLFAGYLLSLAVFFMELAFKYFHAKLQRLNRIINGNE
ncbi:unnamed protein product [Trichogramma brassicae]|uniref:Uncharacterized protein n=1 Tax=Trichogramma brassicae TaxID=86971 RepID=A0A6H5IH24_9HYME|nr:unnamed protein product [Trichogramma brassicae]